VSVDTWNSPSTQYRYYKVAIRTTCIKNVKLKIIKIRTGCQYVRCLYYSEKVNLVAQNLRLGRGLDIADVNDHFNTFLVYQKDPLHINFFRPEHNFILTLFWSKYIWADTWDFITYCVFRGRYQQNSIWLGGNINLKNAWNQSITSERCTRGKGFEEPWDNIFKLNKWK